MEQDLQRTLGRLEGKVDAIQSDVTHVKGRVESLDGRLRTVERKAAVNSSVVASVVATGTTLLIYKVRSLLGV